MLQGGAGEGEEAGVAQLCRRRSALQALLIFAGIAQLCIFQF